MTDFESLFHSLAGEVEAAIDKYLPEKDNYQKTIYSAMRYSVLGGGKRIRGVLVLVSCLLCGGKKDDALPFAAAIEMVHAYSLIHDDLPAMDNDDLRRGKPTNHRVYGEAIAILAGDGLLGAAFETVLKNAKNSTNAWRALTVLADALGTEGMLGGQVVDIESENKKIDIDCLKYLHLHKTGALIKAACLMGAIVGGGDEKTLKLLEDYAEKIGLAFQIRDDILDVEGERELIGKQTGSDAKQNKSTFVSINGLEKSKAEVVRLSDEAMRAVGGINEYGDFLSDLAKYLTNRQF